MHFRASILPCLSDISKYFIVACYFIYNQNSPLCIDKHNIWKTFADVRLTSSEFPVFICKSYPFIDVSSHFYTQDTKSEVYRVPRYHKSQYILLIYCTLAIRNWPLLRRLSSRKQKPFYVQVQAKIEHLKPSRLSVFWKA